MSTNPTTEQAQTSFPRPTEDGVPYETKVDCEMRKLDQALKELENWSEEKIKEYQSKNSDGAVYLPFLFEMQQRSNMFKRILEEANEEMYRKGENVYDSDGTPNVTVGGDFIPEIAFLSDPGRVKEWAQETLEVAQADSPLGEPEGAYVRLVNLPKHWAVFNLGGSPATLGCVKHLVIEANAPKALAQKELDESAIPPPLHKVATWYGRLSWVMGFANYRAMKQQIIENEKARNCGTRVASLGPNCNCSGNHSHLDA